MRTVKRINGESGVIYGVCGSERFKFFECNITIKIKERSIQVPILGSGRVITGQSIVLLITYNNKPKENIERLIKKLTGFEIECDILMPDGDYERMYFNNCMLLGDLDLTGLNKSGECEFESLCSQEMIEIIKKGI